MAFSYSDDAPTEVHKVRLLISDTVEKDGDRTLYVYEDEEIGTILDMVGQSVFGAAAQCLRTRMVDLSKAYTYKLGRAQGGLEVSTKDSVAALMKLAEMYESKAADSTDTEYVDWSLTNFDDLDGYMNRVYDTDMEERDNNELSN